MSFRANIRQHLPLYLVMDLSGSHGRSALEIAREALAGGVTLVQLREKQAPIPLVLEQGKLLRALCREYGVPFVVNDRVDLALLLEADGVHVGQDDIPGALVRRLLGEQAIVGVSASSLAEADIAAEQGADYMGIGAIYATATKADAGDAVGAELVAAVRRRYEGMPLVGIGGITSANALPVIGSGADGVAVVSAITKAASPREAAAELLSVVRQARG